MLQVENESMARFIANKYRRSAKTLPTLESPLARCRAPIVWMARILLTNPSLALGGWGFFFPVKNFASWVGPRRARVVILPQYGNARPVADLENPPIEFDEIWHVCRSSESKNFFLVTF